MTDIVVLGPDGEKLAGIPTPRLIAAGGGKAYFVTATYPHATTPGVWYLFLPEEGYVPRDGQPIIRVRVRVDKGYPHDYGQYCECRDCGGELQQCGGCGHTGHWRECQSPSCYCRRRGPVGS